MKQGKERVEIRRIYPSSWELFSFVIRPKYRQKWFQMLLRQLGLESSVLKSSVLELERSYPQGFPQMMIGR
jgi:hypothetical protein